ncbi:MAG: CoA-binding protein [Chloroflexi bacterium]|nr:CoA-binding protein [Chloroflexota bacterium]
MNFKDKAHDFLAQERIAVAGMSRTSEQTANLIYRTLRKKGHQVFAVNPMTDEVEGDVCYPDVQAIPGGVDGVMIVTKPELTEKIVQDCAEAGVPRVWMHDNTFMAGSVSDKATQFCHDNNITVIDGGCPMMFLEFGHKCMRWVLGVTGRLPK